MQLYLIRHPRPDVAPGVCYGASDVRLAEDPALVARRLRTLLPAEVAEDAPVFTSPLRRCRELARVLHAAPAADARLVEVNFGDWEMRRWDDIGRAAIDAWAADPLGFTPPGGESPRRVLERALDFVDGLRTAGLPAAIVVTHAGVIRMLAGHGQGLAESAWVDLRFAFGSVSALAFASRERGDAPPLFLDR